jgi:pimeloyl-ACP methyl ester carboxylesterase
MSEIVLVGGANLGAWAWERVTPILRAAGHEVTALTLTGFGDRAHLITPETGLTVHATDIAAAIEVADLRDVTLVLHSYAGAPGIVAAARVADRIARIVSVAGAVPTPGRSIFETAPPEFEQAITAYAGGDWRIPVLGDEVLDLYYGRHGLSADDKDWLRARAVPMPLACYRERAPEDLAAVEKLPRTYVTCTGDPGPAPDLPGWDTATIDTGHWPMITDPAGLAALLDRLVRP